MCAIALAVFPGGAVREPCAADVRLVRDVPLVRDRRSRRRDDERDRTRCASASRRSVRRWQVRQVRQAAVRCGTPGARRARRRRCHRRRPRRRRRPLRPSRRPRRGQQTTRPRLHRRPSRRPPPSTRPRRPRLWRLEHSGAPIQCEIVAGNGTSTSAFSARRCARWLCARLLHSAHARRCALSARRSARDARPSSCLLSASAASWHVSCSSSCSRSARRARNKTVSSAETLMPSTSAISAYEQPSSSRMTIAARWLGASCESARRRSSADGAEMSSSAPSPKRSSNSTSCGRRCAWRNRCRQTLCAMVINQGLGFSGRVPCLNAR